MGKTTTAAMFKDAGCPVFDADAVVHALYARGGDAVALIRAVFPDAIKDGAVNRAVLGEHMRSDPLNLPVLESFIHPMIAKQRAQFVVEAKQAKASMVVFDVPLLFETGGHKQVDKIVVVTAPKDVQRARVMARKDMSAALFEKLLSRQMPDAQKRARADYLIHTDKGLDSAREQVQKIIQDIKKLKL